MLVNFVTYTSFDFLTGDELRIGRVPIDPSLGEALSQGQDFMASCKGAPSYPSIMAIVDQLDSVCKVSPSILESN